MVLGPRRIITELHFKRDQKELLAEALIIPPLKIETSAVIGLKSAKFDGTDNLLYSEDVQIGVNFEVTSISEAIEVMINSSICDSGMTV